MTKFKKIYSMVFCLLIVLFSGCSSEQINDTEDDAEDSVTQWSNNYS